MRLRAIELENVRRFVAPVRIAGFGPGLNLLSAPNESGKSTVFDALHAAFFKKFSSQDREVKALVPHAGGDPRVSVEFEDSAGGLWRLDKCWSSRPARRGVQLSRDGRLVAQDDAAEAQLAALLAAPQDGGPAGLLWVRQGAGGLDAGDAGRSARRGLLASVAGEVEAMTGGRQMEAARAAVAAELALYVTQTGRPKAGGPLAEARDAAAALAARRDALAAKVRAHRDALERRRGLRAELAVLEDPEAQAESRRRIAEAEAAQAEADRHAERLRAARADEAAAASAAGALRAEARAIEAAVQERRQAGAALDEAGAALRAARAAAAGRRAALDAAQAVREAAAAQDRAVAARLEAVREAEAARAAQSLRAELQSALARGMAQEAALRAAAEAAGQGLESAALAGLEALWETLRVEERAAEAAAPTLEMRYAPGAAPLELDGAPLVDGQPVVLVAPAELALPGIGTLRIVPREAGDRLAQARDRFAAALVAAGQESLAAARESAARRAQARRRLEEGQAAFAREFPEGLGALRDRIAALPGVPDEAADALPPRADAEAALETARAALARAEGDREALRGAAAAAQAEEARAAERETGATGALARADAALAALLDGQGEAPARLEAIAAALAVQAQAGEAARQRRESLEQGAPDADAARTRLARLRGAAEQRAAHRVELIRALSDLDGQVRAAVGEGAEEELADVETRLAAAEVRAAALEFELATLRRLEAALETARGAARDRYLAPIMAELRPLVNMLLPGAELALDAESVLPETLTRDGQAEDVGVLSGGTREQIALLVRLAFARLLERGGKAAPVILDDAIVYSDDSRIERLFDALAHQAQDLQIVVLSCRQKAFRDLGARRVSILPAGDAAAGESGSAAAE